MTNYLSDVFFVSPGGNDTAIIFDSVPRTEQKNVSLEVQRIYPNIEQVMFCEDVKDKPFGQMAGGEFCGNATRALAYCLFKGNDGEYKLGVSGSPNPMKVVIQGNDVALYVEFENYSRRISQNPDQSFLIDMDGIFHLVIKKGSIPSIDFSKDITFETARTIFEKYNLMDKPACGLMVYEEDDVNTFIEPYVYVKDVDTFFKETACASGSIALAFVKNYDQNIEIMQPSGIPLTISIDNTGDDSRQVCISGPVQILNKAQVSLKDQIKRA